MQYMLLIYNDEQGWAAMSDEERNAVFGDYLAFTTSVRESGNFVDGAPLQPTSTATSVRVRSGDQLVTDGPFAETKEQLGSCYRLSSKDGLSGRDVDVVRASASARRNRRTRASAWLVAVAVLLISCGCAV